MTPLLDFRTRVVLQRKRVVELNSASDAASRVPLVARERYISILYPMGYGTHRVQNSCGGGRRLANAANCTKFEANADFPVPIKNPYHINSFITYSICDM